MRRPCRARTFRARSIRTQAHPGGMRAESRIAADVLEELRARGHDVGLDGPWSHGQVTAVARERNGVLERRRLAARPRRVRDGRAKVLIAARTRRAELWIEPIAHRVAQEVEGEHRQEDRQPWADAAPPHQVGDVPLVVGMS